MTMIPALSFVHRRKKKGILPWKGKKLMTEELCKCVLGPLNVLQCYLFFVLAFIFFFFSPRAATSVLQIVGAWKMHLWVNSLQEKKIESARAVHRGNYAETVKYAGWEGSGHILKAQPKQNASVSTSSPWQHYLIRPSLGRMCLCLQRAGSVSPSQHRILPISLPLPPFILAGTWSWGKEEEFLQRAVAYLALAGSSLCPCPAACLSCGKISF